MRAFIPLAEAAFAEQGAFGLRSEFSSTRHALSAARNL